jgi:hypothetical protein
MSRHKYLIDWCLAGDVHFAIEERPVHCFDASRESQWGTEPRVCAGSAEASHGRGYRFSEF